MDDKDKNQNVSSLNQKVDHNVIRWKKAFREWVEVLGKKKKREMLGKQMAGTLGMRAVPLIKIASGFLQC